ncbi:uncharacterized protein [Palaemon carinicauda]|uniref:uncharacterized protein n=1 Tax=Palaemon carinicauda TaxID=392227 RepID=UPI0035B61ED1
MLSVESNEANEALSKAINADGVVHLVPSKIKDVFFLSLQNLGQPDLVVAQGKEKVVDLVHGFAAEGVPGREAVQEAVIVLNEHTEPGQGLILGGNFAASEDLALIDPESAVGHAPMNERGGDHVLLLDQREDSRRDRSRSRDHKEKDRDKERKKRKTKGRRMKKKKENIRCPEIMMKKNNWDMMERTT